MRFYTSILNAPLRVVAAASARMIRKAGRCPLLMRHPPNYTGPLGFGSDEERDAFMRDNWQRTDFHVKAALRLANRREANDGSEARL